MAYLKNPQPLVLLHHHHHHNRPPMLGHRQRLGSARVRPASQPRRQAVQFRTAACINPPLSPVTPLAATALGGTASKAATEYPGKTVLAQSVRHLGTVSDLNRDYLDTGADRGTLPAGPYF
jgi:hypothetical protein